MYAPDRVDTEFPLVCQAHDRNDEVLERIYIGRHLKNDNSIAAIPVLLRAGQDSGHGQGVDALVHANYLEPRE